MNWDGGATPPVSLITANVDSGPGSAPESSYVTAIAQAEAAGVTVLGYVWTDYGGEPTSTVEAEVNQWKSFYDVTSIFFDGASVSQGEEKYYQTVSAYVHESSGSVGELNPGSVPAQRYMDFGDVIDVFEGSASEYESFTMPSWATAYPASDFSNIVYGVSSESGMATALARAQLLGTGYVYHRWESAEPLQ